MSSGMPSSGVTSLLAAYGVGSPLLWWSVTIVGVVLLVLAVFLLREPATAGEGSGGAENVREEAGKDEREPAAGPRAEERAAPPAPSA